MIIINDEELLRTPCEDVKPEEVEELRQKLEAELAEANRLGKNGIGLAAPQIGIFKKMAIIRMGSPDLDVDLINCNIKQGYDEALFTEEGCLSFPGKIETTLRYQEVHVENNLTYPHSFIATGLLAIAIQHELDHLNGVLLADRAIARPTKKVGPNEPCPCGKIDSASGKAKKYKKCCGKA